MLRSMWSLSSITATVLIAAGLLFLFCCWEYSDPDKHFEVKYDSITRTGSQIEIEVTITNRSGEIVDLTNVLKSCVCINSKFEKRRIADGASASLSYRVDTKKLASSTMEVGVTVLLKYPDSVVSSLFVPVPKQVFVNNNG